jgi:hypothetical protein
VLKWLRKLFDVITAGEAPADVDAVAHRSALWTAFVVCFWLYAIGIALNILMQTLYIVVSPPALENPSSFAFKLADYLAWIYIPGPGPSVTAFGLPFFIYAFTLRYRKGRIPFAIPMLLGVVLLSSLVTYPLYNWMLRDFLEMAFLVVALGTLRMVGTKKRWKILSISISVLMLTTLLDLVTWRVMGYALTYADYPPSLINLQFAISFTLTIIASPVLLILPISLMSDPPPFALQGYYIEKRQAGRLGRSLLTSVLILAVLYGAARAFANALTYSDNTFWAVRGLSFIDDPHWSIYAVLFALAVAALFTRRAPRELVIFLFLIPLTMMTSMFVLMLGWLPPSIALSATLLVSGLIALALTGENRWSAAKLRAAGILAVGYTLLWLWCLMILPRYSHEFGGIYVIEASYPIISAAIARFALLAYIPAVLFAAWWFISPKEIESLVLGKEEPTTRQRDGDGSLIP